VGRLASLIALVGGSLAVAFGCGEGSSSRQPADRQGGSPARGQTGGLDPALASRLQETLDRVRKHQEIPGAAAAVVIPGQGVWTGTSGEADTRTHRPVTDRTLFGVGSVTKTFVAALMLKLAERDVLDLDDHLSRWVPEFPNSRLITLRQLLNHTSGTSNFTDDPAFAAAQQRNPNTVWTPRRTLRYAQHPDSPPGETWDYSNTNYVLAGLVIARATRSTVARTAPPAPASR
jgi:D-alanyl-D-alanine carboxypeptidase